MSRAGAEALRAYREQGTMRELTLAEIAEVMSVPAEKLADLEDALLALVYDGSFELVEGDRFRLSGRVMPDQAAKRLLSVQVSLGVEVGVEELKRGFDAPSLNAFRRHHQEGVDPSVQECVCALRELRAIRRGLQDAGHIPNPQAIDWAEQLIAHVRAELRNAERREAEAAAAAAVCSRCRQRPRWFGDLCKRCTPAAERPSGKVGASLVPLPSRRRKR